MAELQWLILRKNSRFLLRGRTEDGTVLSKEPGNLFNRGGYRNSGLVGHTLSVLVQPKGSGVVLTRTDPESRKGPFLKRTRVKGGKWKVRAAVKEAAEAVHRQGLSRKAFARYDKLHRAAQRHIKKKKKGAAAAAPAPAKN